ncbi:hypothetical protein CDAR_246731 [Caerostris darwini]|uniref:Uncharacterized protein n=1 Tax=Caerostris darwini TaxID=1538125 RepID=A0AAV4TBS4_9ARAC|nr:hypothetical protein CDAR_246731 [Caerostris darwini]
MGIQVKYEIPVKCEDHPPKSGTTCIQTFIFIKTKTERRGEEEKVGATFTLMRDGTPRLALIEALKYSSSLSLPFAPRRLSRSVELQLPKFNASDPNPRENKHGVATRGANRYPQLIVLCCSENVYDLLIFAADPHVDSPE